MPGELVASPKRHHFVGVLVALVLFGGLLAACGNANVTVSTSGNSNGVFSNRIVIGALSSQTGPLTADLAPVVNGVEAYFDMVNAAGGVDGRKLDLAYSLDDQSDPSIDALQARALVQEDHVFAVVGVGTPSFPGGPYLADNDVPTFGEDVDPNNEWAGSSMFGTTGSYNNYTAPQLEAAFIAEQHHVHAAAVLSYSVAESQQACVGVINGFKLAHIPVVFEDESIPAPATDLDADVNRLKSHGVDMIASCMDLSGNIDLAETMQQSDVTGVTQLWYDGYDQSALDQDSSSMQGVYYLLQHVPFEEAQLEPGIYPGIDQYETMMGRYQPSVDPSDASLDGWISADEFVASLRKAGPKPTREAVVEAMNKLTGFTANGIIPPIDWKDAHGGSSGGPDCSSFVQVVGKDFVPVYGTPSSGSRPKSVFTCLGVNKRAPDGEVVSQITPLPPGIPPSSSSQAPTS